MKRCVQCNAQVDDIVQYCPQCGGNQFIAEIPTLDSTAVQSEKKSKKHLLESIVGALFTIGIIVVVVFVNTFSGTFKKSDAKWFVNQAISEVTSGTVDNRYLRFTNSKAEEIEKAFDELLDIYTNTFCETFLLEGKIDENGRENVHENIKTLLSKTSYEVVDVTKNNGFDVTVKMKTFSTYSDLLNTLLNENALNADDNSYVDFVLEEFTKLVASPSYGEEKIYTCHVFLEDDFWQIDDEVLINAAMESQYDCLKEE